MTHASIATLPPLRPLGALDQAVRSLILNTLQSSRVVNRYVVFHYSPFHSYGINSVMLAKALAWLKWAISDKLGDLLAIYERDIRAHEAVHPGRRVFPTLTEHVEQVTEFYDGVLDVLFDQGFTRDIMARFQAAWAFRSSISLMRFTESNGCCRSSPGGDRHLGARYSAAESKLRWEYSSSRDQVSKLLAGDSLVVIEGLASL
ncbi:hypothetical protein DV736_g5223, partial [Chaetothyriales sp. CBS 134916]